MTLALALHDSTAAGVAYERLVQAALRDGNHTALASLADTGQRLCVHDANCQVYFLNMRGESARVRQRYDSAAMYYAAADSVSRLSSPRFRTDIAHNLGFTLLALGRVSEARARFREALQHALADRDRVNTAFLVAGCASAEAVDHRAASAGSLFGLYDSILEQTGRIADPADVVEYDRYRSRAREQLGQSAFDETVRIGRRMNADSALASLLGARR
ncbi:MAG TPA: hypothetical protein VKB93_02465 [Thermoanaerobaculia bacterium]|nr:hypothetical protein [Thermoanaerobaculia bacterium]